ncbi:MAG TPA: hypothetical protein VIM89_15270 [Mucilaginibacter sp.]
MKRYTCKLITLLFISAAFLACKKGHEQLPYHVNEGTITENFAYYDCATCGGYFIKFTTDTSKFYRTFQDLSSFGVTDTSKFPLKVTIGWKPDTTTKLANFITVLNLKIDN